MKNILIIGATSGFGYEIASKLLDSGYRLALAGRRVELLENLVKRAPDRCFTERIDICADDTPLRIDTLIEKIGGIDTLIQCSGIGWQNQELNPEFELKTVETNAKGFVRVVDHIFNYFKERGTGGHIVAISSIAGTKGLGTAPAYSATKRFNRHYLDCLVQLSNMEHLNIKITDIRPGFAHTALIEGKNYPMQMDPSYVADQIIKAVKKKKRVKVIDWRYSILVFFWNLLPQSLWERITVK